MRNEAGSGGAVVEAVYKYTALAHPATGACLGRLTAIAFLGGPPRSSPEYLLFPSLPAVATSRV